MSRIQNLKVYNLKKVIFFLSLLCLILRNWRFQIITRFISEFAVVDWMVLDKNNSTYLQLSVASERIWLFSVFTWIKEYFIYIQKKIHIFLRKNHSVIMKKNVTYFKLKRQLCFQVRKLKIAHIFVHQTSMWHKAYVS
jgi:hypothetical protein